MLIAALVVGIWACCCRRRNNNRTQVTYVEPYRNAGSDGYNAGPGYNAGYSPYGGARGVGEDDGMPLTNVGGGFGQEYKPPAVQNEMGYDERR